MKRASIAILLLGLVTSAFAQQKRPPAERPKPKAQKPAAAAPADDATLTTNVKEKLSKTPSLKDTPIDVSAKDGVVTLKGTVKTAGLKGVATNVTKSVKGVKKVDNQLAIEKGGDIPKKKPQAEPAKKS